MSPWYTRKNRHVWSERLAALIPLLVVLYLYFPG